MADQASDKVDATAPVVAAPAVAADNVAPEQGETAPKVEAKTEEGDTGKEDKPTEGEEQFLPLPSVIAQLVLA
jgi:hypothetical protein